jgi:hypothetical protein
MNPSRTADEIWCSEYMKMTIVLGEMACLGLKDAQW